MDVMEKKKGPLVLIGFMGCGKTTIGIRLSYKLRMSVEDTDKIIETRQGVTISEIFATQGEEAFRKMETELLRELAEKNVLKIYSVGGGTPVREENRTLLKKMGTVLYLRASAETVYDRLKYDTTRPLLQGDHPKDKIRNLMESRKTCYEEAADFIVDVDGKTTDQIIDEIMGCLAVREES